MINPGDDRWFAAILFSDVLCRSLLAENRFKHMLPYTCQKMNLLVINTMNKNCIHKHVRYRYKLETVRTQGIVKGSAQIE
jgi:hypothetical protein